LKSDLRYLNEWKNDEETFQFLGGGFMPTSIDQQETWMEEMIDTSGPNKRFIICDSEGTPIGMVGIYNINWINRTAEIGAYIGDKNARGKGYAKEASNLIEKFAYEYVNLRKLKLSVVSDNVIAVHMWQSLGYKKVGEYVAERFIKGAYRNLILMEKFIGQ